MVLRNLLLLPPNKRKINFVSDPHGNSGKSELAKLLAKDPQYNAVIAPSLSSIERWTTGFIQQLTEYKSRHGSYPTAIIFDLARAEDESNIDALYPILEHIKDGRLDSTFYGKFKRIEFKSPHLVVLTNSVPNLGALSKDRFSLFTITGPEYDYSLVCCHATAEKHRMNRGLVSWFYEATPMKFDDQRQFNEKIFKGEVPLKINEAFGKNDGDIYALKYKGVIRTAAIQRAPEYIKKLVIDSPTKGE